MWICLNVFHGGFNALLLHVPVCWCMSTLMLIWQLSCVFVLGKHEHTLQMNLQCCSSGPANSHALSGDWDNWRKSRALSPRVFSPANFLLLSLRHNFCQAWMWQGNAEPRLTCCHAPFLSYREAHGIYLVSLCDVLSLMHNKPMCKVGITLAKLRASIKVRFA